MSASIYIYIYICSQGLLPYPPQKKTVLTSSFVGELPILTPCVGNPWLPSENSLWPSRLLHHGAIFHHQGFIPQLLGLEVSREVMGMSWDVTPLDGLWTAYFIGNPIEMDDKWGTPISGNLHVGAGSAQELPRKAFLLNLESGMISSRQV